MLWGILAYLMWGFFPAYFPLLEPASPVEILAHRFIWTCVVMIVVLAATGRFYLLTTMTLRQWSSAAVAAVLIATNWGLYILAVNTGHVADAALGYFINPLISVALGVLILREQLRPLQRTSVIIASVAVAVLTWAVGHPPIIALGLALSFGLYGLVKKQVSLTPEQSLTAESTVLAPIGVAYVTWLEITGNGTFLSQGVGHSVLLFTTGIITVVPLLLFAYAAKTITLTSLGMIQYITPILQMLWAVFVTREPITSLRWFGFCIIFAAVAVFFIDSVTVTRSVEPRRPRKNNKRPG